MRYLCRPVHITTLVNRGGRAAEAVFHLCAARASAWNGTQDQDGGRRGRRARLNPPAHPKEFAGVRQERTSLRLAGFLFNSAPASRPCAESRCRRRAPCASGRRGRAGNGTVCCGLYAYLRTWVRRAARRFCASEQTRTNRADLSRPCKRAGAPAVERAPEQFLRHL